MVLVGVKAMPADGKPSAAVAVRISTGEKRGFGASVPLSTRASSIDYSGVGDSAIMMKLIKLVAPISTLLEKDLSAFFARSTAEAPSVRMGVFMSGFPSASVARRV